LKTASVVIIASVLLLLVTLKFLVPTGLLILGYGSEVPLPSWLVRSLSPRAAILMGLSLGPLPVVAIVLGAWLVLRR